MTAWLTRNRWYLVALAVLLPVAFVVSLIPRWFPYQGQQPQPESVALGETVRYSGADIELTALELLDGDRWAAPAGSDVVVATLSIDVVEPPEAARCEVHVVSSDAGFERRWDAELYSDSDYVVPDRFESLCTLTEPGSYDLQLTFLVPRGQVEQPVIELSSSAGLPRVLRLS
ncbi:hypothetical protein [Pseudolysinimonas sp.]|jgi:hypothetical protein|uniref:hypothetical protein n=1 Tax=Pseudolysinimonas sp. TaxID=2680009 RepID=UPI0037847A2C